MKLLLPSAASSSMRRVLLHLRAAALALVRPRRALVHFVLLARDSVLVNVADECEVLVRVHARQLPSAELFEREDRAE
ncbi:MAG: hypothetical protein DMF67_07505 [Acidobacteria bacterium]|nr:MAG: hypothetical protein DMF67_07505 [Acidobacteriota bacterium]